MLIRFLKTDKFSEWLQAVLFIFVAIGVLLLIRFAPIAMWQIFESLMKERLQVSDKVVGIINLGVWAGTILIILACLVIWQRKKNR